jgi:hypothetical protein
MIKYDNVGDLKMYIVSSSFLCSAEYKVFESIFCKFVGQITGYMQIFFFFETH